MNEPNSDSLEDLHKETQRLQRKFEDSLVQEPEKCINCKFGFSFMRERNENQIITCRRYPPYPIVRNGASESCYPGTTSQSWCGEYKRSE